MAAILAQCRAEDLVIKNSGGWRTLLQILAPTNQRGRVISYGVYPRSTTNSSPGIKLRLVKQTTSGTAGVSNDPVKRTAGSEAIQFDGWKAPAAGYTVEPTAGDVQDLKATHPQMPFEEVAVEKDQWIIYGGERWGLQYDNDGGEADIPCDATIDYEE